MALNTLRLVSPGGDCWEAKCRVIDGSWIALEFGQDFVMTTGTWHLVFPAVSRWGKPPHNFYVLPGQDGLWRFNQGKQQWWKVGPV